MELIEVRNPNFVCSKMSKRDVSKAFTIKGKLDDFIYNTLIEDGYVRKVGDRYFSPTEALLDMVFLKDVIKIEDHHRRFLTINHLFYRNDLTTCFNEQEIKWMIRNGYLTLGSSDARYRKSTTFDELLSDGIEEIKVK